MNVIRKQGIFLFCIFVLVLMVVGGNFVRYQVAKDYLIFAYTECNPLERNCFETSQEADFVFYEKPYAKVEMVAKYAPACLNEHTCSNFSCEGAAGHCQITYCSEELVEEGEVCTHLNP